MSIRGACPFSIQVEKHRIQAAPDVLNPTLDVQATRCLGVKCQLWQSPEGSKKPDLDGECSLVISAQANSLLTHIIVNGIQVEALKQPPAPKPSIPESIEEKAKKLVLKCPKCAGENTGQIEAKTGPNSVCWICFDCKTTFQVHNRVILGIDTIPSDPPEDEK